MKLPISNLINSLVDLAIAEDLSFGDISSELLETKNQTTAELIAKQELVVCGLGLTIIIAERAGLNIKVENLVEDGDLVCSNTRIQKIQGSAKDIVSIERIILNFIQRLSGVATFTRSVVNSSHGITILDTRKTMPGFRLLEKYATAVGGAKNHRMHLGEMIMIKNNHIDAAAGVTIEQKIENLMNKLQKVRGFYTPVEFEVRNMTELAVVLMYKPKAVLLDNMSNHDLANCMQLIQSKAPETICEVSGGITVNRLEQLAAIGVKVVSMGSLTTKANNVDISLKI
jgi:nicotinate-nucleotide pyrophosphorylase (carboxylating)